MIIIRWSARLDSFLISPLIHYVIIIIIILLIIIVIIIIIIKSALYNLVCFLSFFLQFF